MYAIRSYYAAVQGTIVLGVVETIVHTWLPRLIERLAQSYPALSLELDIDRNNFV